MRKFKIIIPFLLFCFVLSSLYASDDSIAYVCDYDATDDFSDSIFPTYVIAKYPLWNFDTIKKKPLKTYLEFGGGYEEEDIDQDPLTGLKSVSSDTSSLKNIDYGILFSNFSLLAQQEIPLPFFYKHGFRLNLSATYTGRWQQATPTIENFKDNNTNLLSLLNDDEFDDVRLYGTPDLEGNRYFLTTSLNLGLSLNFPKFLGFSTYFSNTAYFSPSWMNNNSFANFYDGEDPYNGAEFNYFRNNMYLSETYVFFRKNYKDLLTRQKMLLLQLKFSHSTSYKYLEGSGIPKFMQTNENYRYGLSDSFRLTLDGPRTLTADTYPYISVFFTNSIYWGDLNNVDPSYDNPTRSFSFDNLSTYYGYEMRYRLGGIFYFKIYQDIDYSYSNKTWTPDDFEISFYVKI